jgi:hypothetical protein
MLTAWENFYVIVGSSAAALTGLQFVVIALVAEARRKSSSREIAAFGTPTIVHFCAVLLISTILSAPWPLLSYGGLALACCGITGSAYGFIIIRRARRQTGYKPVLEDWLFHAIFPLIAYIALFVCGILLSHNSATILFVIAGVALFLLFIGIHNAWDAVIYIAVERYQAPVESTDKNHGISK